MPQLNTRASVRVKGKNRVIFRGHKHDIVRSVPRNHQIGHIERLCVSLAVDGAGKQLSERRRFDRRWSERQLLVVHT
jgi:hypothetical protein